MSDQHSETPDSFEDKIVNPHDPVDKFLGPLTRFLRVEASGGLVLLAATVIALILANSPWAGTYFTFWKTEVGFKFGEFGMMLSLKGWVSDGLMTIFFFVVGLEIKREMIKGELKDFRRAMLPIFAAVGGMVVPALIYLYFQNGQAGERGWGIPMATDIAFVVGILAVLGNRIPRILGVMLLSLAIVDDIGAILVIAIGYTDHLDLKMLLMAFAGLGIIFGLNKAGVRHFGVYIALGFLVWIGFHESGVHATIAGVILGLMTPSKSYIDDTLFKNYLDRATDALKTGRWKSETHRGEKVAQFQRASRELIPPMEYLEDNLHPWSSYFIMPIFALANAGVAIELSAFTDPIATAVMAGLIIGKPVGIVLMSFLCVKLILKKLPEGLTWPSIIGGGFLSGIGFTMALFVAGLALDDALSLDAAKVGIIGGSLIAAIIGIGILIMVLKKPAE